MNPEEIIEMAELAGWTGIYSQWVSPTERQHLTVPVTVEQIEAFAKLVAAKERYAVLDIAYGYASNLSWNEDFQAEIRSRGEA